MYLQCNKCSKQIEKDWIVCPACGNPLDGKKEVSVVENAIRVWKKDNKMKYSRSPAEETVYGIFQEGKQYITTLRDEDCEVCDFGAMAAVIIVSGSAGPVSCCANCGHVQKMDPTRARARGLRFDKRKKHA
ncbi:MAG: hypothetical protein JRN62_03530 [Nitrososphaerota archaeon]|nr:hypothetical protein [Nitrososphaerota archaeon]MDG6948672.1 hypothetical protein [Nitrososphaerota archaeon]